MARLETIDLIPGTEVVFRGHHHDSSSTPEELVLIPRPTNHSSDPLVSQQKYASCEKRLPANSFL